MQRPIILIVTDDKQFEQTAIGTVLDSYHGAHVANCILGACQCLGAAAENIAMAVIDLDLGDGLSLLHILGGCDPDFPVVAVTADRRPTDRDEALLISSMTVRSLAKPVTPGELREVIEEVSRRERPRGAKARRRPEGKSNGRNSSSPHGAMAAAGFR